MRTVISLDKILNRIHQIHGSKYTYPYIESEYKSVKESKLTIVCPIHGKFYQSVASHVCQKYGCNACGNSVRRLSRNTILSQFKEKHGTAYDYSKVIYGEGKNVNSKVTIICPTHGEFEQSVYLHKKGQGCPSCASSNGGVSFKALTWLNHISTTENIKIIHAANGGEYKIPGTFYRVDGFSPSTNTVYEFHGDIFHGNVHRYDPMIRNHPYRSETVGELYALTMLREKEIRDLGYNLITIWESDYDKLDIPLTRFDITTFKRRKSLDDLNVLQIELLDDEFVSTEHKHRWKCKICDNEFVRNLNKSRIAFREHGRVGCSLECSNNYKGKSNTPTADRLFNLWDAANGKGFNLYRKNGNEYKGMNSKLLVECKGCASDLLLRPVSIERAIHNRKSGCRTCFGVGW